MATTLKFQTLLHEAWQRIMTRSQTTLTLGVIGALIMIIMRVLAHEPAAALLSIIGTIIYWLAWIGLFYTLATKGPISVQKAFQHAGQRFFPVVGYTILNSLLYLPIILSLITGVGLAATTFMPTAFANLQVMQNIQTATRVLLPIFIILIPFSIYFGLRFCLVTPLVILGPNSKGPFRESWKLTEGHVGQLLLVGILYGLVVVAVSIILNILALVLALGNPTVVSILWGLVSTAISVYGLAFGASILRRLQGK